MTHAPSELDQDEPSLLFLLAHRVVSDLLGVSDEDLALLKEELKSYGDEDLWNESPPFGPLKVCEALRVESTFVDFGVNTSGTTGADFWITIERNGRVSSSDGMDNNDVELYPRYTEC